MLTAHFDLHVTRQLNRCSTWNRKRTALFSGHYLRNRSTLDIVFWVISVYFNIRNTLPKSGTFLLGHPVYQNLVLTSQRAASFSITKTDSLIPIRKITAVYCEYHMKHICSYKIRGNTNFQSVTCRRQRYYWASYD